ncbi:SLBB domain-containing protein [Glacieibacterium frigidum]|uniref:SLBB domain-containing protein n=1 Tax=Glacieibacterium frigidum TaxID=2593303 RepID=UPI00163D8F15|nr:SLBB domain-containing protein [Glacieibacterium frigidum]
MALVALPSVGHAQSIDPRVLAQVQGQLGSGNGASVLGPQSSASPLDRARDNAQGLRALEQQGIRIDTPEEQELRRIQSRAAIERLYRPSPVEREFRDRLSDPTLRQFGYELFQSVPGSAGSLTGAVSDSYIIGPGDEIVIQFQGATNDSRTVRVDREGRLVVGTLPAVRAAGRSLGAVRNDLAAATRRTLLGTDVYVSLGTVRAATVFVGGEVERPGQFQLTSLADISAALAQAGGVRRTGSLRNVRVVRAGGSFTVDLYGLLGIGSPPSVSLRDGDRIIVPVIGDTVAIAGNVARPGIYEIRRGTSVAALLDYAGGALRPRGNQIAISRIAADGSEEFVRSAALGSALIPGDAVQLTGGSAGGAAGRVLLRGFVANPGPRSLGQAPTVRDLLGEIRDLRFDTYLPMAVLVRRDPGTAARVFEPVNLLTALTERPGVPLRSDDRLYVFGRSDIDFLNRTPVRRIVLGQPNSLPECTSLDRLEALVRDTQSARFSAVTRGSFIVERGGQSDIAATGGVGSSRRGEETLRTGADQVGLARGRPVRTARTGEEAARDQVDQDRFDEINEVNDPYGTAQSARLARDIGVCPAVFEEEPELLPVLIENAVAVSGAVRRPGAYPIAGSASAKDIASAAEGLLGNTTALTLDVTRASGETTTQQRLATDIGGRTLATTRVVAGDDLRFNAAQPQYEAGGVLLTGEFGRPGLYSIRKGETLSQLMARAGGLSPLAYAYGTVFTRRSVKELQQEGFRRTGRELTNSLLAVSARKTGAGSGDSLLAAQGLIQQLTTVEAPGRVVVEADPRVLAVRPDLDTVLESGDAIYVPKRPNFVLALGDVNNPGALQFINGKSAKDYLAETGGTQSTADDDRIFVVLPNGTSQPLKGGRWARSNAQGVIPPGSTIIVPKNIDPLFTLDIARDITTIVGTLFTSIATVALLATN